MQRSGLISGREGVVLFIGNNVRRLCDSKSLAKQAQVVEPTPVSDWKLSTGRPVLLVLQGASWDRGA